jgi:hypothetical protein
VWIDVRLSRINSNHDEGRSDKVELADFLFRRYVSRAIGGRFWHDHHGEGSMTLSRRPVEGIA